METLVVTFICPLSILGIDSRVRGSDISWFFYVNQPRASLKTFFNNSPQPSLLDEEREVLEFLEMLPK